MEVLFRQDAVSLFLDEGSLKLSDGAHTYVITSHPYEPCLYLRGQDGGLTVIHNAYEVDWIVAAARENGTLRSITGKTFDTAALCRMLLAVAGTGELSIDEAEARVAAKQDPARRTSAPRYPISLTAGTLRERIVEMMDLAGGGPNYRANLRRLKERYAAGSVPIHPAGERFLSRYAYLFNQLSPGFEDEEDNLVFYFETFDDLPPDASGDPLLLAAGLASRAATFAGCPVTPVGVFGFRNPPYLFAAENGLLYAYRGPDDPIRTYASLTDLLADELSAHPPIGLDD